MSSFIFLKTCYFQMVTSLKYTDTMNMPTSFRVDWYMSSVEVIHICIIYFRCYLYCIINSNHMNIYLIGFIYQ